MKDLLKAVLRRFGGPGAYALIAAGYGWGITLLNYYLVRLSRFVPFLRVGVWPHALFIEGTNNCNAKCVFCAYTKMRRAKGVMPLELFKGVVDQYAAMGGGEVDLTPIVGDPFVDAKLFERLEHLAGEPRITRYHFFTNAIGMRPELADRLLEYCGRLRVYVSYGGFDRETYRRTFGVDRFEAATANMRYLIDHKRERSSRIGVQINLRTPKGSTRGEVWEYLCRMKAEGVIELTWMGAYDSWGGMIPEHELKEAGLEARLDPVRTGPCHRLFTSPVVLVDGRVNACACRDVEGSLIIGDLTRERLAEVLRGPKLLDLIGRHARGDFPEICSKCTYYDPVYPGWMLGSARRPDPSVPVPADPE